MIVGPLVRAGGPDSARLVADVRSGLGVTRELFARLTGFSVRAISGWEAGRPISEAGLRRVKEMERLRAALFLHANGGETAESYLAHALAAAKSLWRYLDTPTGGLWRDRLMPTNRFVEEPAPASSLYHLTGAVEAMKQFRAAGAPAVSLAAQ